MKKIKTIIVSHRTLPNPIVDNLKIFLSENYDLKLLEITHPLLESEDSLKNSSKAELFTGSKEIYTSSAYHWNLPVPLLYIKDLIYTLFWILKQNQRWDIYFGIGNLNPIIGILLKKMGKVKKVVYWSMDYFPNRFDSKFLNWFYFQVDKFCVRFADETWNVSPVMIDAREKNGLNRAVFNRQITVPGGIWFDKTKRLAFHKIDKNKIVYRGTLLDWQGLDLVIHALPLIIKKLPKIRFEIMGSGQYEATLRKLTKRKKIEKHVIFHGLISDRKELEDLLKDGVLGVATFNTKILDDKVKNADPGKIKDYMVMGMPVVVTDAISYHQQISDKKAGIVVKYDPKDCAEKIINLIGDNKILQQYRRNAVSFINDFDWNKILRPNVERVLQ